MWYRLAKRFLFALDAEKAHDITLHCLEICGRTPVARFFGKTPASPCTVMGLAFDNRVGLAAGLDKNGDYIDALACLGFGFIEVGTVTPLPQPGNQKPRLFRIPERRALINRMGFNNKGVDYLVSRLEASRFSGIVGVNIGKNLATSVENAGRDYLYCLSKVYAHADYVAVNVSSPNTPGLRLLQSKDRLAILLESIRSQRADLFGKHGKFVPVLVKVAPDLTDEQLISFAKVFNESGLDGVIATNTTVSRQGVENFPRSIQEGGLSGAPLRNQAEHALEVLKTSLDKKTALVASGGIMSPEDAEDRVRKGADLVQLYSGLVFAGPGLVREVSRKLQTAKAR